LIINLTLLFKLIKRDYDVYVVLEDGSILMSSSILIAHSYITNTPLVIWSGAIEKEYEKDSVGKKVIKSFNYLYRSFMYKFADRFIAYSSKAKQYLISRGASETKIEIGGQVMPESELPQVPSESESETEKFVFLYLGYLRKKKGVHHLIRAFKRGNFDNSLLRIAGIGPYEEDLEKMAMGDDNIEFVGYIEGKEKAACYNTADVLVLPTLYDSWGLVVNEAVYYGLPVILSDAAGATDLINDTGCGTIVEPRNIDELLSAMTKIRTDHEYRAELQSNIKPARKYTDTDFGVEPVKSAIHSAIKTN